jgi:hypothetical protein
MGIVGHSTNLIIEYTGPNVIQDRVNDPDFIYQWAEEMLICPRLRPLINART